MDQLFIDFVLLIAVVALWTLLFRYPEYGLAIQLAGFYYYPTIFGLVGRETTSTTTIGFYLLLTTSYLCAGFYRHSQRIRQVLRTRASALLILFTAWMVLNWFMFSFDSEIAREKIALAILLMWVPYLGMAALDSRQVNRFMRVVVALGIVGVVLSLAQISLGGAEELANQRFSLTDAANPLGFAMALGISAVVMFAFATKMKFGWRWLGALGFVSLSVYVILMSGSRGPLLGLGVAIVFCAILIGRGRSLRTFAIILISVVGLFVSLQFVSGEPMRRFMEITDLVQSIASSTSGGIDQAQLDDASSGRWLIWQSSFANFLANPVAGVGVGNDRIETWGVSRGVYAHNFFLETAAEMGIPGLLLFFGFLFFMIRSLVSLIRQREYQVVVLAAISVFIYAFVAMSFSGRLVAMTPFWISCSWLLMLDLAVVPARKPRIPQRRQLRLTPSLRTNA